MNFILKRFQAIWRRLQPSLSLDLWIDLLESGYSDEEINQFFGSSSKTISPLQHVNRRQRQQISLLETRMSPRQALWWTLSETHLRQHHLRDGQRAWGYPIFLLLMALVTMLFLNHVLADRLQLFTVAKSSSTPSNLWFSLLQLLELLYMISSVSILICLAIPKAVRNQLLVKYADNPMFTLSRQTRTHHLLSLFAKGIQRGIPLDDVLYGLMSSQDALQNALIQRVYLDLNQGLSLGQAMQHIDLALRPVFMLNDLDHSASINIQRYLQLVEMKIKRLVSTVRWGLMGMAYGSFGLIIITAYQMMFEPIRLMEELL